MNLEKILRAFFPKGQRKYLSIICILRCLYKYAGVRKARFDCNSPNPQWHSLNLSQEYIIFYYRVNPRWRFVAHFFSFSGFKSACLLAILRTIFCLNVLLSNGWSHNWLYKNPDLKWLQESSSSSSIFICTQNRIILHGLPRSLPRNRV